MTADRASRDRMETKLVPFPMPHLLTLVSLHCPRWVQALPISVLGRTLPKLHRLEEAREGSTVHRRVFQILPTLQPTQRTLAGCLLCVSVDV